MIEAQLSLVDPLASANAWASITTDRKHGLPQPYHVQSATQNLLPRRSATVRPPYPAYTRCRWYFCRPHQG